MDAERPFSELMREELLTVVETEILEKRVVQSWSLVDTLTMREEIEAFAETVPQGNLEFRSWLNTEFLTSPQSSVPDLAGIRTAILGTLWVTLVTIAVALPLGVGAAIYLEEYASAVGNPYAAAYQRHHSDQYQQSGRRAVDYLRYPGAGNFCTCPGANYQRGCVRRC